MQRWLYLAAQLCRCDEKTVRMNGEMWAWDKQQLRREKDWMHSHRKIYTHTHKELRVLGGKCMCSNCICHLPPRNTLSLPSDKSPAAHAAVYCARHHLTLIDSNASYTTLCLLLSISMPWRHTLQPAIESTEHNIWGRRWCNIYIFPIGYSWGPRKFLV